MYMYAMFTSLAAMTLPNAPEGAVTELGSMLFTRFVSGARYIHEQTSLNWNYVDADTFTGHKTEMILLGNKSECSLT